MKTREKQDREIPVQYCQSCGMPLISDELLGTNKDGSPNTEYCYYCYQHGAYTCDCTMDEMIKICVKHMMEQNMGDGRKPMSIEEGLECVYRAFFPTLKRWRKCPCPIHFPELLDSKCRVEQLVSVSRATQRGVLGNSED